MTNSASDRYAEANEGISALYEVLTEQVENRNVSTQEVPDYVHEEAMQRVVNQSQLPWEAFRGKSSDDVKLLLSQYSHDNSKLAQNYLEAVKKIDQAVNSRDEHDRQIDALIQHYMEDGIEDYDLIFRETEVEDQDYSLEDLEVELTGRRNYEERPTTDADFWVVDLENERLLFQEEKSGDAYKHKDQNPQDINLQGIKEEGSEVYDEEDWKIEDFIEEKAVEQKSNHNYQDRKERQLQDIRDAVESVNEELNTEYSVETQPQANHNLTETRYPMPKVYKGDVHLSDEVEEEEIEEFEEFVNSFLHELSYDELERLEPANPEYSEAL